MNSTSHIKYLLKILILGSLVLISCGKDDTPKSTLVLKDNLLYKENSTTPFTGRERALVEDKIVEYEVKDGLKHGEFKIFTEDGVLEVSGKIDSNKNVGKWSYYFPDGIIESEGYFVNDKPDGLWIWNYPDGKKREEGNFLAGVRVGVWHQFDKNGEIVFEKNYDIIDSSDIENQSSDFFKK